MKNANSLPHPARWLASAVVVLAALAAFALATLAQAAEPKNTAPVDLVDTAPVDLLRRYAPTNAALAEKYKGYVTKEVGFLAYGSQGTGTARTVTNTTVIPPNVTYDGKGEVLTADANTMSDAKGDQSEKQKPLFILCPGAGLKNVTITAPGCDGIHMMGDNSLDNIVWQDVGEDAASVRSYFPGGKITIKNCKAFNARDKIFQFNTSCDVKIENFTGDVMGKFVKHMASTDVPFAIDLNNITVSNVMSAVVLSESTNCVVRYHNVTYHFKGGRDKPDQVFRLIPKENVTKY
jgi:pectate lyase C